MPKTIATPALVAGELLRQSATPTPAPATVTVDYDVLLILVQAARGERPAGLSAAIGAGLAALVAAHGGR